MSSLSRSAQPLKPDWRHYANTGMAVLAVWAVYALIRLAIVPLAGTDPSGPDDYMRLLQVRDLLAGQAWYDVTQYRMDSPHGASMHWSRLVDLPLAAFAALLGETAALALVPLLYLLPALFALHAIMKRLGLPPLALLLGLAILPLFPLIPGNFAPMRIDHHAPQAVAAICCAALLLSDTRRSAALSGILAAAWLVISLEGLPLIAVIAGLYGLRYLLAGDRLLPWFLGTLALAAPALSIATRPLADLSGLYCDILLPGHMIAFAAAALVAAALRLAPRQDVIAGRFVGLAAVPLICAPLAFLSLGQCITDPFSQMDPLLQTYWHGFILEGLPIWRQPPSVMLMLLWTIGIVAAGWRLTKRSGIADSGITVSGMADGELAMRWNLLALLAIAAGVYSLLLMRAGLVAQFLTIPFAALLISHFLPRARALQGTLPRVFATFGVFVLVTPTMASAALKPFDEMVAGTGLRAEALALLDGETCDYSRLAGLPEGHIFAPLDRGPEVLFRSPHSIVMAGYHRNQARMGEIVAAYTGPPGSAEALVRGNAANYVLVCTSGKDVAVFRTARPDNLANMLADGKAPAWLEPVPGFINGSLKLYRVLP